MCKRVEFDPWFLFAPYKDLCGTLAKKLFQTLSKTEKGSQYNSQNGVFKTRLHKFKCVTLSKLPYFCFIIHKKTSNNSIYLSSIVKRINKLKFEWFE